MSEITANDLKTRGISVLNKALEEAEEAIISVRGKPRFVVMDIEHFERLREAEIHAAWQESKDALSREDFVSENADTHIARLRKELPDDAL